VEQRVLGRTGISVSELCLGAMMFGAWGNQDQDDSIRIIHRALDAGITFIDTADVYSHGESEEIVGRALAGGRRDQVVLATKVHSPMADDPNSRGNSRRWIIRECEDSLRRLQTEWIDLYQIHRPDPTCDIDETLGALTDLVRAGKIRCFGSSTFPASLIVEAQWVAERRVRERFVCEQPPYSILVRGVESEVLPVCQRYGMGDPLEPARRRLPLWRLPARPRGAGQHSLRPAAPPLRPLPARQPAQAGGSRRSGTARRRGGPQPDSPRPRLRAPASGGDGRDHRAAHHGASGEPARRR